MKDRALLAFAKAFREGILDGGSSTCCTLVALGLAEIAPGEERKKHPAHRITDAGRVALSHEEKRG